MRLSSGTLFYFCFLFFIHLEQRAQGIRHFSSPGGKKNAAVNNIAQSKEGFLWLGSDEGLVRFNGKNHSVFRKEDGLAENAVSAVFCDSRNTVWAGHSSGKISLIVNGKCFPFPLNAKLPGNEILSIYEDKKGIIYFATHGSGLLFLNGKSLDSLNSASGLADDIVYCVEADNNNGIWIGTDAGLNLIDITKKKQIIHIGNKQGLPDNIVRCIKRIPDGRLLVGMQDSGLCYIDPLSNNVFRFPSSALTDKGAVISIDHSADGKILVATENGGLFFLRGNEVLPYANTGRLSGKKINKILADREGNIWIASSVGLSMLFQQRHLMLNSETGLPSDKITCVFSDGDNSVWAGSDKGLTRINYDENGAVKIETLLQELAATGLQFTSIAKTGDKQLMLGTYGNGVILYDPESGKISRPAINGVPSSENISGICFAKNGFAWLATLGGGIICIDAKGNLIRKFTEEENGLASNYVYQVHIDKRGDVWAAVDGGAVQLLQGNSFVKMRETLNIDSKTVYSITEDASGTLWMVTSDEGVIRYDGKKVKKYSSKNGLRDLVPPIIAATGSKIVCVHNRGIDLISPAKETVTSFDLSDNDLDPNLNAAVSTTDGILWFGTGNGLFRFRVLDNNSDTITPAAFISKLKVQFNDYSADSCSDFRYNQNNFIFEFDANWLHAPDKVRFRHMLAGLENDWQQFTVNRIAAYNNLPPGEYEFRVQACNEEGVWGSAAVYKFSIAAPLWQHWWFWLLVATLAIVAVYFFMRFRLQSLQKQNAMLEEKVSERTREIVKQNKVIEEKNRELEQLSLVASKTENVVLIMDGDGWIEYVNDSFSKLNGITFEELISERGPTIYDVSNNPDIEKIIAEAVRDKKSVVYESLNVLKDGSKVWESSTLTPIFDEKGELKKLIIIDNDITERKRQEQIILQKNRDITDSITYAQKIQTAILPDINLINKSIPASFVLYLIKDIVSGDFYWFSHKDDAAIIAAVDCTGHGVPGAFMSLIGYNLLNQIVNERNITEPAMILTELNKGVIATLHKKDTGGIATDGMDVALCRINTKTHTVEFAGAMRPLIIITEEDSGRTLTEVKGEKIPIGTFPVNHEFHRYCNHTIHAEKNQSFYIFTDGYADQFGGEKGRKLSTGRFKEILLQLDSEFPDDKRKKLMTQHLQWKGNHEQIDDILVIGFKA